MLGPFSIDMYLTAFPEIAEDLGTQTGKISYTLSSYFIGIAIGQLIYGPILDRYGRKKPLYFGLSLYFLMALGCVYSNGLTELISYRFFQGLGGAVGMVASRAIIRDRYESEEIAKAFSALILVMGLAPIVAPMAGGFLLNLAGWKSLFLALAGLSLLIILLILFGLKESKDPDPSVSLQLKPVLKAYWQILRTPSFYWYATAAGMSMAGVFTYIAGSPTVIREVLGFDEYYFGWIFGSNALGYIGFSQLNRLFLKHFNTLNLSRNIALIYNLLAVSIFSQALAGIPYPILFLINLFLFLSCLGMLNPNMQALALEPFKENAGVASALIGSLRMLVGTFCSALLGILSTGDAVPMTSIMLISGIIMIYSLSKSKRLINKAYA